MMPDGGDCLSELNRILSSFYPSSNENYKDTGKIFGSHSLEAREGAISALKSLAIPDSGDDLSALLLVTKEQLLAEANLKTNGIYYWQIFPSVGGTTENALSHILDMFDDKPADYIKECLLNCVLQLPDFVDETLSLDDFAKGYATYDSSIAYSAIGEESCSLKNISSKLVEKGVKFTKEEKRSLTEARKKLEEYSVEIKNKAKILTWEIGWKQTESLYKAYGLSCSLDELTRIAKDEINYGYRRLKSIAKKQLGVTSVSEGLDLVKKTGISPEVLKTKEGEKRLIDLYREKETPVMKMFEKDFGLPDVLENNLHFMANSRRESCPGIYIVTGRSLIDGKVKSDIFINPEDITTTYEPGILLSWVHELWHAYQEYYGLLIEKEKPSLKGFLENPDNSEGSACYVERFCENLELTALESFFLVSESMRAYTRLLCEIATFTGRPDVFDKITGFDTSRFNKLPKVNMAYLLAVHFNAQTRLQTIEESTADIMGYVEYPEAIGKDYAWFGAYGRGTLWLEMNIGKKNPAGAVNLLKKGTFSLAYMNKIIKFNPLS
jgi:hypothetical protein